jgi:phasin
VDTGSRQENASKQNGPNLGNVSELLRALCRSVLKKALGGSRWGTLQPPASRTEAGAVDGAWICATAAAHRSGIMSDDGQNRFEIPKEMRSMAEASFDQARKGFEKFLSGAQATAGAIEERGAAVRAGAKDISAKAMSYAEKNVQASLDYAQALLHAKDLTDVMRLHSEYVRTQMRSLAEQASEMGQAVSRAAMDAAKPKS